MVKNMPVRRETRVRFLGREVSLEEGMAIHSSILAWRIPWTEKPGRLQSMGLKESDMTEWLTHTQCFQVILWFLCKFFPPFTCGLLSPLLHFKSWESFYLSILTDLRALYDPIGMSRVPARQLQQRRKWLSVCPSCWQHNDWHQWQHSHRVYGLHQREMLSGKVQILPSSRTSASQDQGCPIPGQPGCRSTGCSHCSCHGE